MSSHDAPVRLARASRARYVTCAVTVWPGVNLDSTGDKCIASAAAAVSQQHSPCTDMLCHLMRLMEEHFVCSATAGMVVAVSKALPRCRARRSWQVELFCHAWRCRGAMRGDRDNLGFASGPRGSGSADSASALETLRDNTPRPGPALPLLMAPRPFSDAQ